MEVELVPNVVINGCTDQCVNKKYETSNGAASDCLVQPFPQHDASEITRTTPVTVKQLCDSVVETEVDGQGVTTGEGSNEISRESTPFVTENMMAEEERLKQERVTESNASSSEHQNSLSNTLEKQRYARLTHLLEKSSIYSSLLLKRMEGQQKSQKETKKRKKTEPSNDATPDQQREKSPSSGSAKKQKRGRRKKRKSDDSDYMLSDYINSKGQIKRRKIDEKEKRKATAGSSMDVDQPRYFNGELIPSRQPKLVTGGVMRPYQLDGMEWLQVLYENGINGILGDEMGLGKTLQCVGLIGHLIEMNVKGPFLVVAPLSTVTNWVTEFRRFSPSIPVVLYHGTIKEREEIRMKNFSRRHKSDKNQQLQPVFVTSYEICMNDYAHLADREWKLLIVDEGHRIKNLNCKLIRILKTYNAANRLLLTGTPLQNNLAELWSLLNFILPDIFDDLHCFQSWFDFTSVVSDHDASEKIIAQEKEQHVLSTLHQILSPFLLRRLKTDVEFNIPPKKEVLVYAPLTTTQERYYTSLLNNTIENMVEESRRKRLHELGWDKENCEQNAEMDEQEEDCGVRKSKRLMKKLPNYAELSDSQFEAAINSETDLPPEVTGLQTPNKENTPPPPPTTSLVNIKTTAMWVMLRKCCNHPYLLEFPLTPDEDLRVDEELVSCCGKMLVLDRLLSALLKEGHKVLIFSQWTTILDILQLYMEMRDWRFARLDGTMAFQEREVEMTRFKQSPDCSVFLLSTRAGGLGINLTAADTVIIYDSDWNPQNDLQAQDRCHRIGQTKPVMVYRLVTANTFDQHIVETATGKRRLEKMVIHKGKFKGYSKADQNLTMDDLKELLKSVDHDKVVNSTDIISEDALAALLDRSLSSGGAVANKEATSSSGEGTHSNLFVVLEENTGKGKILKSVNASAAEESPEKQSVAENQTEEAAVQLTTTAEENGEQMGTEENGGDTGGAKHEGEKQPAEDEKMRTDADDQELTPELPAAELSIEKLVAEGNGFKIEQLTAAED